MASGSHGVQLSETNAPRRCGVCGERATAYLHGIGFRCGACNEDAPGKLANRGEGGRLR